jgi:hypothetical protein
VSETKKKLSTHMQKSANNRTSKLGITMLMTTVMVALLLATSASVFVVPAQATILPRDLPVTIPDRDDDDDDDDDDDGAVPITVLECLSTIPPNNFVALSNCITAAVFDDDDVPPADPCAIVPDLC